MALVTQWLEKLEPFFRRYQAEEEVPIFEKDKDIDMNSTSMNCLQIQTPKPVRD